MQDLPNVVIRVLPFSAGEHPGTNGPFTLLEFPDPDDPRIVRPRLTRATWHTSTYSGASGECVEIADLDGGHRAVRDSTNPTGPALIVTSSAWTAFTTGIGDNEFHWHRQISEQRLGSQHGYRSMSVSGESAGR